MRMRTMEDYFAIDSSGHLLRQTFDSSFDASDPQGQAPPNVNDDEPTGTPIPVGGTFNGVSDFTGDRDIYAVTLQAGHTYTFSLQGSGANPLNDTYLELINPAFTALLAHDDDGGNLLNSIITFTATVDGVYNLRARAFANVGDPGIGGYTIDVREMGADAVGNTNDTAGTLAIGGYVVGFRETNGDVDRYAVTLEAGQFYTFRVAGSADYETNPNAVPPGELDTILRLRGADGTLLAENDDNTFPGDISSGIGFLATTSGTYYLDVAAYPNQIGGYVLQADLPIDPTTRNPLESLNWDSAPNVPFVDTDDDGRGDTAYIYFAGAGENFGVPEVGGVPGTMLSQGWTQVQIDGVMNALKEYEDLLGVKYVIVDHPEGATFRMMTTTNATFGARFYNYDPAYGAFQGIGVFNNASGGFGTRPESLVKGGFSYSVILHEFGHAHGIAHPHDTGGGSEIMLGVTGPDSLGVYDLNQGVYTVMSYNEAWQRHPDGPTTESPTGSVGAVIDHGWSLFGALDIAVLQARYGLADQNLGATTYTLNDDYHTAYYNTIVDMGGNDTIAYNGVLNAQIDLTAATLDYSPTGGGAISFLFNAPQPNYTTEIKGGFTIANGVVIENATGGEGNDVLIGNAAANTLTGNGGNDNLIGRGGNDRIIAGAGVDTVSGGDGLDVVTLGAGNDIFLAELGTSKIATKMGTMSVDIITDFDANGNDFIDLSGIDQHFTFRGTNANKNDGDLTYKTYNSVNGAENALGFDIDGNPGASGVGGPVTVVLGNVDGGKPDFMIVLLGTANVDASDFIFG